MNTWPMSLSPLFVVAFASILLQARPQPGETARSVGEPPEFAPRTQRLDFVEIPGVQEFTSRLIVRPIQRARWIETGSTLDQAFEREAQARRELRRYELVRHVPQTGESILRVPAGETELQVADALMSTGEFEYVEPDWKLYPAALQSITPSTQSRLPAAGHVATQPTVNCPNDPLFPAQWHHKQNRMDSCEAWTLETGTPSVSIGVCDTGVRTTHEDLLLHRLEGYNAVDRLWESEGGNINPVHVHGTRTTGTAAANGNNGVGVSGVGWNLSHRMIRVSNVSDGGAYLSDLQHGARTAIESGDRIANVSYHGAASVSNPATATYIKSIGGLLLWGAGNTSSNYSFADRDDDDLIVVGATNQADGLAYFSSYGTYIDLVAPGVAILTTDYSGDSAYTAPEGTSYACPLTSGVCAMIWSARPTLSPNDVERILKASAEDIGAVGIDDQFGYGRINLLEALSTSGSAVPTADFGAQPVSGTSPLTVEFTDLASGVPTAWLWDFGDGTTSTEQNPSHVYTTSGAFDVTQTVSNVHGADMLQKTGFVLVDIIPPIAEFSATPTGGLSPLFVQFSDESGGGVPTSWEWDFGDGATSTAQHPSHVYASSGFYTVGLTVTNAYGFDSLVQSNYVAVDFIPPVAAFSGVPTSGASPLWVDFTDESTGGIATSWQWYFGDGGSSTAQNPSHTYSFEGSYSVRLTATNAYGSDLLIELGYINVGPGPPMVADFVGTPLTGSAPLEVSFTDLSVGNMTLWDWEFGDGSGSTLRNPTHVYTSPGVYDVSLQVCNAAGSDASIEKSEYITVE